MNQVSVKHLKFLIFNLSTLYKKMLLEPFKAVQYISVMIDTLHQ